MPALKQMNIKCNDFWKSVKLPYYIVFELTSISILFKLWTFTQKNEDEKRWEKS